MSTLSLLDEKWIPVVHFDGHLSKIQPSQLVDETISDLAYLRPDFQGAAYQFLIGLLQTTLSPEDNSEWRKYWNNGFSSQQLTEAFEQVRTAMQFGATKPSFMQDFAKLEGKKIPITNLLIDAPGENALKKDTDHFVKRGFVKVMCPHCAAMALFTLQTNAPAGGQGHRVSLRGVIGPITTLIMPEVSKPTPLWKKLWLNVIPLDDEERPQQFDASVFPWLAPTKTSEPPKNLSLFPEQANYCQAFWGMPRRIELDFHQTEQGQCDICGELSKQLITQYQAKNYGIQYQHWQHPLTPYSTNNKTGEQKAIKVLLGGLIYRDWLGMVSANDDTHSARVVTTHFERNFAGKQHYHLWCFGYNFKQMDALCWYEHLYPVYPDLAKTNSDLKELIAQALELSKDMQEILKKSIEIFVTTDKKKKKEIEKVLKKRSISIEIAYWKETELLFYEFIKKLIEQKDNPNGRQPLLIEWADTLLNYVTQIYDKVAFGDLEQSFKYSKTETADRISCNQISGRKNLLNQFNDLKKKYNISNNFDYV
ncbi:type I-E CRISPR-associated protein Cse1/CasA [Gilliamella sp. B2717]|uniref:type I-E CRISPR-associated protein Cse1/CasA n=1 Tax=Gilliamella sp. B2717 TaxID=2817996 RepID=UPI002269FAF3|nr:type I-E CRISPR-associated protein Cse1/CasA [Gilliamella sp. B2717]MCX8579581.1 type I-E CRISPR-associated protein Cse1/CasA [Gilliamella sp. B2717]